MENQNQETGSKLVDGNTPTPWSIKDTEKNYHMVDRYLIVDANGEDVIQPSECVNMDPDVMEKIVRAVNEYDEDKKTIKALLAAALHFKAEYENAMHDEYDFPSDDWSYERDKDNESIKHAKIIAQSESRLTIDKLKKSIAQAECRNSAALENIKVDVEKDKTTIQSAADLTKFMEEVNMKIKNRPDLYSRKARRSTGNDLSPVEATHTPTPWELSQGSECVIEANNHYIGETDSDNSEENAEFIVRSVNSHEALLEAAKAIIYKANRAESISPVDPLLQHLHRAITQAEARS